MALLEQCSGEGASPVGGPYALPHPTQPTAGGLERALRRFGFVAGLLDALDRRAREAGEFDRYLNQGELA